MLGFWAFFSCQKPKPVGPSQLPPMEIHTEGCFSPHCTTLVLAHPNDNFFFENTKKYRVVWRNETKVLEQGPRLDCVHKGIYHVRVESLANGLYNELTYELLGDDEE
jgi:hypothetical protein